MNQYICPQHILLSHPAYTTLFKLPKWNCKTSALRCHDSKLAARLIKRSRPDWSKTEHLRIAAYHLARNEKLLRVWNAVLDRAAIETLQRPWHITDYRVSGIGRAEFPEKHKRVLRHCIHLATEHRDLARAHLILSKRGS